MRPAALLASALAAVLLAGCTSDAGDSPTGDAGDDGSSAAPRVSAATPSGAARRSRVDAPPAPEADACYRLRFGQLTRPSNGSEPVPCSRRHDTGADALVGRVRAAVPSR